MSTRSGKRKAAQTGESAKKPTLKIPEKVKAVRVYENLTGDDQLGPKVALIPAWKKACNDFLAATTITRVDVNRDAYEKFSKQESAKNIVEVEFSFPGGKSCVFSISSRGDGGWHDTRVLSVFTPTIDAGKLVDVVKERIGDCNGCITAALYERIDFAVIAAESRLPPQSAGACIGDSEEDEEDLETLLRRRCTGIFSGVVERSKFDRDNPHY